MKKRVIGLVLALVVLLTACPGNPTPTDTNGTWDSSQWDSTALWQ